MKKLFYLGNCSTCKRIIKGWDLPKEVILKDIKTQPLNLSDLKELHQRSGSYQALFSRRAKLFHERQLGTEDLDESRYKELLLEHYTFLKRPLLVWEEDIYIGSSKDTIEQAYKTVHGRDLFWSF